MTDPIKAEFKINPIFTEDDYGEIEKQRLQKERMTAFANFMWNDGKYRAEIEAKMEGAKE